MKCPGYPTYDNCNECELITAPCYPKKEEKTMRFIQYKATWQSEGSDHQTVNNNVEFWLKRGVDVHLMMWPFLNLAELDAADFGYAVDVEVINELDMEAI